MKTLAINSDIGMIYGSTLTPYSDLIGILDEDDNTLNCAKSNFPNIQTIKKTSLAKPKDVKHPDVIFSCCKEKTLISTINFIKAINPKLLLFAHKQKPNKDWFNWFIDLGYVPYCDFMETERFGIPYTSKKYFSVGFRRDIRTYFLTFPFPDPPDIFNPIKKFLDLEIYPSHLLREDAAAKNTKIIEIDKLCPALNGKYSYDKSRFLINSPHGKRILSVNEFKNAIGYDEKFKLPTYILYKAYEFLGNSTPPILCKEMLEEMDVWLK